MAKGGHAVNVLHFAGPSGAGKTRLIEALIPYLPVSGVLKWSHHLLPKDPVDSDTGRFAVHQVSTWYAAIDGLIERRPQPNRALLYRRLASELAPDALLMVEGDKRAPHPKIWVGGDLPPATVSVSLILGPIRPTTPRPWRPVPIPLTALALTDLIGYFRESWPDHSYTISPEECSHP